MLSQFKTNAEKLIGVFMSTSNEERGSRVGGRLEVLKDFFSFDLESLDDSASLLDFLLFVPQSDPVEARIKERALAYWSTCFISDILVTLLLNLNTKAKSRSTGYEVVALEVVGVGVSVACYGRGLKKGCGGRLCWKHEKCRSLPSCNRS
ncbi:hypothetical protein Tco_0710428 [Tanacetum coccineum]